MAQDPKAIDVVQFILEQCLLRREKNMKDKDGKPIVDLPLKTVSWSSGVSTIVAEDMPRSLSKHWNSPAPSARSMTPSMIARDASSSSSIRKVL